MIYREFNGDRISMLGFGMMRLPVNPDKTINVEETEKMIDKAIRSGINYFDTAWPYHNGESEIMVGKILSKYPRNSFLLADKYPGHQINDSYNPAGVFEKQLIKCGVDYFDYYMLHNVYENCIDTYLDPKWKIIDYFIEQKEKGRIRNLGFSTHARTDCLERFLSICGDKMDFCQIQLNYLDWTLQDANKKLEILKKYDIPIWVMEPVRGGRLADLGDNNNSLLKKMRPNESIASWSFRWLQSIPDVKVIISGMTIMSQLEDNIRTFTEEKALTNDEEKTLLKIAEGMKNCIPCTRCNYCIKSCPVGIDIPVMIGAYNEISFGLEGGLTPAMHIEAYPPDRRPKACISCGACEKICPQHIKVPKLMKELADKEKMLPSWEKISIERKAAVPY